MKSGKKNILIFATHPIQYKSPLYKKMAGEFDLKVVFFSDHGLQSRYVEKIGKLPEWDLPMLEGFSHSFLKNASPRPNVSKFWGLINWGVIREVRQFKGDYIWIEGWHVFSNILVWICCQIFGKKLLFRAESPLNQELLKKPFLLSVKKILLGRIFFKGIHRFLFIGEQNKAFYSYYGVPENKFIFAPYCVDNERFTKGFIDFGGQKEVIKEKYGIPASSKVILFTGKLIYKKRPLDLLKAFELIKGEDYALVIVGQGELEEDMRAFISEAGIPNVYMLGYKNQTELPAIYAMSDLFILPSGSGETWGLVVNEAMNYSLPVITSDMVGCSKDLVRDNGFVFKLGDYKELAEKIRAVFKDETARKKMGIRSSEIVKKYAFKTILEEVKNNLD